MRLDKLLSASTGMSRADSAGAIRRGEVSVNGTTVRRPDLKVDEFSADVLFRGAPAVFRQFVYVMLNKPAGTVSTTDDTERSVMKLLPKEFLRHGMFPCGRLDADTTGLLLLTDDGALAHRLLSPRHHAEKEYRFRCDPPLTEEMRVRLEGGLPLGDFVSKPARVSAEGGGEEGTVVLTEGKYHQIKRMFEAVGSRITALERIRFGGLVLDPSLAPGECRRLTPEEEEILRSNG